MKIRSIVLFLFVNLMLAAAAFGQASATYTDKKNGFSVGYPSDFKVLVGARAKSETAFGDPGAGVKLAAVAPKRIPEKYHGDYQFNVWRSAAKGTKCGAPAEGENLGGFPVAVSETEKTRMIDGHEFYAYGGAEGGMSKSLGIHGYRGMVGGKCWMIQSMTYQVSAFEDFKSFDDKIIDKAFEKFVTSFKFVK
jgi:hypothetical protein